MVEVGVYEMIKRLMEELVEIKSELVFYKHKRIYLKNEMSEIDKAIGETEKKRRNAEENLERYKELKEKSPGIILIMDEKAYFKNSSGGRWIIEKLEMEHSKIVKTLSNWRNAELSLEEKQKMLDRLNDINQELAFELNNVGWSFDEEEF